MPLLTQRGSLLNARPAPGMGISQDPGLSLQPKASPKPTALCPLHRLPNPVCSPPPPPCNLQEEERHQRDLLVVCK